MKTEWLKNVQIIILGVCIVFATVFSTLIFAKVIVKVKKMTNQMIVVTGSAEKKISSDYIVWDSSFSRRGPELTTAFNKLKDDLRKVKAYLLAKGIGPKEIIVAQVNTKVLYKKNAKGYDTNIIEGYLLTQSIEVRSYNVEKVDGIARRSTELLDKGIQFISSPPQYFYTKLAQLKVEMLAEATANARKRAESIADSTKSKIGVLRYAKMGVFQITPVNSYDISWYGNNDTTSLEKKVTAVVNAAFEIKEN